MAWGSRRVQLVIEEVVGTPERVVLVPGGGVMGTCGRTAKVAEVVPVIPNASVARIVRT
jgi:hypothetical protein